MRPTSWTLTCGVAISLGFVLGACSDDGLPAGATDTEASTTSGTATMTATTATTLGTMGTATTEPTTASTGTMTTVGSSGTDPTIADSSSSSLDGSSDSGSSSSSDSTGSSSDSGSGSSSSSGGESSSSSSGGLAVIELDWGFGQQYDLAVDVGDTVRWTWIDGAMHTVSSIAGGTETFDSGIQTGIGQTFEFTFDTAGSTDFQCNVHPVTMFGTITAS